MLSSVERWAAAGLVSALCLTCVRAQRLRPGNPSQHHTRRPWHSGTRLRRVCRDPPFTYAARRDCARFPLPQPQVISGHSSTSAPRMGSISGSIGMYTSSYVQGRAVCARATSPSAKRPRGARFPTPSPVRRPPRGPHLEGYVRSP